MYTVNYTYFKIILRIWDNILIEFDQALKTRILDILEFLKFSLKTLGGLYVPVPVCAGACH